MEPTDAPRGEDLQYLEDQINEHNLRRTGRRDYRPLAFFVRDHQGAIVAGLSGFTWAGWLEIKFVWVREDLRGQGRGRELVEAAEAEARARGCQRVWLDSYTFQAPAFYQRLGYEVFGVLHGYPAPHDRVFLTKALGGVPSGSRQG
jgi:GNAT superfamily N-acetyltransferase